MSKRKKYSKKHPLQARREGIGPSDPHFREPTKYTVLVVCGLLLVAVAIVFGQTVRYDFVNYDDQLYVYDNLQVAHGLTAEGIAWAFTTGHASNWHPLTWLSHMLDCQLYGLHAGGHHLTNILLHAATVILLLLVLWRMTGEFWPSAFVAAVFAIHPLRVESVAWVSERKDVLSGLFFMLTLWAYVSYVRHPFSLARYLAVVVIFALGLMAKPMLVTLPFVLLLLDFWPLGRITLAQTGKDKNKSGNSSFTGAPGATVKLSPQRSFIFPMRLVVEKIPLLLLTVISCIATSLAQREAIATLVKVSLPTRIANAVVSYVAYLGQLFYPVDLAVLYPHPMTGLAIWRVALALLVLVGISLGALAYWRRHPYLLVGWLWYLGMLVPVIGLVQAGSHAKADRYTYLPQIGLTIALAWGVMFVVRSWPYRRWLCGIASALVVAALMGCAWRQTTFWRDSETLWTHTLACTSQNIGAQYHLGVSLGNVGRLPEAIELFKQILQLDPDVAEYHNSLGVALFKTGRQQEAIEHLQEALRLKPDYAQAHYNLGTALDQSGQMPKAIKHFEQALQFKPDYFEAHNNLGLALVKVNRIPEAIEHYHQALRIKPDYAEAQSNLGLVMAKTGRLPEAIEYYQQALRLKSDFPEAHNNLGITLSKAGRLQEAIEHYQQALQLKPDFAEAYFNLALIYNRMQQSSQTIASAQKALELARSQGNMAFAKQIEDWLNSYRASLPEPSVTPPTSKIKK
jgi:protein O-mannosyl-transferase